MNGMIRKAGPLSAVQTVFPLGYDSRRHPRFVLIGGGYTIQGERDDGWLDVFRPAIQINIRDVSISGVGMLCKTKLTVGSHLIIFSPSGAPIRVVIVRSLPDPLFPKLFRVGCRWCGFPRGKVFSEWLQFIDEAQLPLFQEEITILSKMSL
ncbi:hypothetical protein [Aeromonas allosaccharophila]|uniref:hypothetical protein n=1 Tax=Aeromonas allosaccharophila TaxID=656 RepID=UPI003D224CD3